MSPYIKQWVGEGGELDHFPIYLEVKVAQQKPPSPFKLNVTWLEDEGYIHSVKSLQIPHDANNKELLTVQFLNNLKKIKAQTIS